MEGGSSAREHRRGTVYGVTAYLAWGLFPLFFKTLAHLAPSEVLAHRIVWAWASLAVLMLAGGTAGRVWAALRNRRALATLSASTALICVNWFVFLYAVASGRVLQSSLGYFITPLVSVLLGRVVLGERLGRVQAAAVALAAAGVAVQAALVGEVPTIALILAASFGGYGLLRKLVRADPVTALAVETTLLSPVALGYLVFLGAEGRGAFLAGSGGQDALLVLAGAVTAMPLVLFGAAVGRLRLATVGLLQYIVPTMHFLLAVFAFGEPFTPGHLASFALIWTGLAVYTWDVHRQAARPRVPASRVIHGVRGSG